MLDIYIQENKKAAAKSNLTVAFLFFLNHVVEQLFDRNIHISVSSFNLLTDVFLVIR